MATLPDRIDDADLQSQNTPETFWRLLDLTPSAAEWQIAGRQALDCFAGLPFAATLSDPLDVFPSVLGEGQFGPRHWQLSRGKQLYYQLVRPVLPQRFRPLIRHIIRRRQAGRALLNWPIEDRFVRFQSEWLRNILINQGHTTARYIRLWPSGKRFAFVLTHDVEAQAGQQFVREVAALEERYGFHSSFNFVPEEYRVDHDLLRELRARGFEVGVHGLTHDGKLFLSKKDFERKAKRINAYFQSWDAVGFRSPLTHRHPQWMQALHMEYDSSFFDTDPYEPIPGGTLSIWPFFLGHFVELPYTLAQDHTLMVTLGEATPRLWLDKVDFIARYCGLALVNTHPDYLKKNNHLAIYETFLQRMRDRTDHWHALASEVARWWRKRASAQVQWEQNQWSVAGLSGATIGEVRLDAAKQSDIGGVPRGLTF